MIDKVVLSAALAVRDIPSGASIAVGGFGLCGIPVSLIAALHALGVSELETISNNCGVDDWGLGILLTDHRIRRTVRSAMVGCRSGTTPPGRSPWHPNPKRCACSTATNSCSNAR
jgi:acyl CoA:acetate/3-ketoacid CoA transferase alpha subunit